MLLVVFILFVVTSGAFFINSIINPVRKINDTASKIAKGDFNVSIEKYKYDDEIGQLACSINNLSVALWNDLRAEGIKIPVVGSSDVHKYEKSIHFPYNFTICFAKERTQEAFIEAIRQGNCVAVKARGTEYEREHDCYGNLRYVTYAQFLLRYFFRKMERFCVGEGVAMRSYAMGEVEKEYVECQSAQSRLFRARFFGKEPPVYPTKEILEFEERHRKIHLNSPITRGSGIISDKSSP